MRPLEQVARFTKKPRSLNVSEMEQVPFVPMASIPEGVGGLSGWESRPPTDIRSGVYFEVGDVLLAKITPCLENGKQVLVREIPGGWGFATTEVFPLSGELVSSDFLDLYLREPSVRKVLAGKMQGTTGRQRLPKEALQSLPVPVPPPPEQRAIVHMLRSVQNAKEATEQVIAAAWELKVSVVSEYVARDELPETWLIKPIGDVASRVEYGVSKRGGRAGRYPMLRMNSISDGRLATDDLQWVDLTDDELHRFKLQRGDVLFNRTNSIDKVGKSAYFDLDGDWVFASYLLRVSADKNVLDPRFLNYFLGAPSTQATLRGLATRAVSQANINATKLKGLTMPVPPLFEQREIADALQAIDAKIDAEEARRDALATLFDSLLHELMTARLRVTDLEVPA